MKEPTCTVLPRCHVIMYMMCPVFHGGRLLDRSACSTVTKITCTHSDIESHASAKGLYTNYFRISEVSNLKFWFVFLPQQIITVAVAHFSDWQTFVFMYFHHKDCLDSELHEVVRDCMLPSEQQKILETMKAKPSAKSSEIRERAAKVFEAAFKNLPPEKRKAGEAGRKAKLKAEAASSKAALREANRIYDRVNVTSEQIMRAAFPPSVRCWTDEANGRWRLSYKYLSRSISWTAIGHKAAAAMCLKQAWQWIELCEGSPMSEEAKAVGAD